MAAVDRGGCCGHDGPLAIKIVTVMIAVAVSVHYFGIGGGSVMIALVCGGQDLGIDNGNGD
eukprot:CAMPEP_0201916458 /NCGR_PEP_ID=MMETSP0903-20130614/6085_1 /ASSEMBLY_ACC=CAM_ASM_000552 /TAXON_ID=420261 /ORGANISM="Thalassiosira antarctica, Strain CCMP982" /LENGTH=60 /DNA_ID=CAMNT_0048452267 /DNA_START=797 /DNA_END=976 /DNA_ORIENTATION=-